MTRNNLRDHLAWLLGNAQLSRPIGPSLPAAHDAFDTTRSFTSVASQPLSSTTTRPHAPPRNASSRAIAEADLRIDDDELFANEDATQLEVDIVVANSGMARLTTKPSKKPSLISKQEQLPAPHATGVSRLQQAYSASLSKNDSASEISSTISRPGKSRASSTVSRSKKPAPRLLSPVIHDDVEEDLLDLTEVGPKPSSAASHLSKIRTPSSAMKPRRPAPKEPVPPITMHDLTGAGNLDPDVTASTDYTFGTPTLLWTEDHASRPEPPSSSSRGVKRKSSALAESPRRAKPKPGPKRGIKEADDDEFPDIYDLVDSETRIPATIKRRHAAPSPTRKNVPMLQEAASDTMLYTQRTFTHTLSTTETMIRRTASADRTPLRNGSAEPSDPELPTEKGIMLRPPSAKGSSPVNQSPIQRTSSSPANDEAVMTDDCIFDPPQSPSPRPTRRFKRSDVVVDSDDEFQTPPARNTSDTSFITADTGTTSGSNRKPNSPTMTGRAKPSAIETPSKRRSVLFTSQDPQLHVTSRSHDHLDKMEVDGSNVGQKLQIADREPESHSSGSNGETLVMDMYKQQPHVLDMAWKILDERCAKNLEDFKRSHREKWPAERRAQVKREKEPLSRQKQALNDVKAAHETYRRLDAQHEELLGQITIAYDLDQDVEEAEARLEELSKAIEESELLLKAALIAAQITVEMFHDLPDPPAQEPEQPASNSAAHRSVAARMPSSLSRESTLIPECASQNIPQSQGTSRPQSRVASLERPRESVRPHVPSFPREEIRPARASESRAPTRPSSRPPQQDEFMEDFLDDEELWDQPEAPGFNPSVAATSRLASSTRTHSPAKSKHRPRDNFSDYGDGDEDFEEMVAMAEQVEDVEQRQSSLGFRSNQRARSVLSEASGNAAPSARVKASVKKPLKPVPKLRTPPELMKHPWSNDVLRAFKDRFRLEGFRHNQLEAINATLEGKDAFVLMPTGGGKSLCYQLPAVVNSGKTRGITIVVTPLLSLMQDQVDHLVSRGIAAKAFNGDMDRSEKQDILQSFKLKNPEHHVQLLYVTPEMINKSTAFLDGLKILYRNKKLARLVIDEAHCVSQWGHDFRPDYKELGQVRAQFPGVPVMALTATATNNVILDVQHNLNIKDCKVFSQSFNRHNLYYEVRQKERQPVERIAELINERYRGKSGIVYTLSRKQTEQIAKKLSDQGIRAEHYHAAMKTEDKTKVQREWQGGRIKVVVATIAFGMGIDKPDVRFVIHHHLPKSLEGYYQETGRAGRDGLQSDCYLFFGHGDIHQLRKFIEESDGNRQQKERQKEMLNRVVMFCENVRDCRRSQLLHYFGESFSRDMCNKTCDNCREGKHCEIEDRTVYAQAVLQAVMYHTRLTMVQCTDILRGTKKPGDDEEVQSFHGIARNLKKPEVFSIIVRLAQEGALGEENKMGGGGIAIQYFILGRRAAEYLNGETTLQMLVATGGSKNAPANASKKSTKKKAATEELDFARPVSTCISSPVRSDAPRARKGKSAARFFDEEAIVEDDEDEDPAPRGNRYVNAYEPDGFVVPDDEDDDYFEPPVRPPPRRRQRTLDDIAHSASAVPTEDAENDVHDLLIGNFLDDAKKLEEETRNNKSLRRPLFTEVQMKQMAVKWTDSLDKMRRIPGIDAEKVNKYGSKFIPLVNKWHEKYLEVMGQSEDAMMTIPATAGPSTSRRNNQQQQDDVIDLVSDDDDEDDYEPGVPSKYFGVSSHNDPIQSQLEGWQSRFDATTQIEEPTFRGRSTSKKGAQGGKRQYYRKGGSRGGSKSYSGVSKRGGSRRTSGASSARSGASKSTSTTITAKKSGGGSTIGLMPY